MLWRMSGGIEQGYQQLKEELADHFEGRSWRVYTYVTLSSRLLFSEVVGRRKKMGIHVAAGEAMAEAVLS